MRRLRRSICYYQGLRISVAYIFSRTDNDPARNKPYVLSTFQHTGQIVQSSVGITAGASAPEVLIQEVLEQLQGWGGQLPHELAGIEENVMFSLPKALRIPVTQVGR